MSKYKDVKNFRKNVRRVAVQTMGGKCQICEYDRCMQSLELHHIDQSEKEISFNQIHSWDILYIELSKAILLCANCHREVHYNNLELPQTYVRFDAEIADALRNERKGTKYHINVDDRIKLILSSNIDFSKPGWGAKLRRILDINSNSANTWVKRNMYEFYTNNCYKYKER